MPRIATPFLSLIGLSLATALLVVAMSLSANDTLAASPDPAQMRSWIEEMKTAPRGPFRRIRWFCEDGTVLPPQPYACHSHGGGVQHGEWSEQTQAIRRQGYLIATLLADLDAEAFVGPDARLGELRQILLERFLIGFDDGWIFRRARFYRGAVQVEDEQRQARVLLLAMLGDPEWRTDARYALLREAVRLLPLDDDRATATTIRELSTELAEEDPGFQDLRVKLHGMPGAGDAGRVRAYAERHAPPGLQDRYRRLADELDTLYEPKTAIRRLETLAGQTEGNLAGELRRAAADIDRAERLDARLARTADHAVAWRNRIVDDSDLRPAARLRLLQAGLALEQEAYAIGSRLASETTPAHRRRHLGRLGDLAVSLHAAGLISARQLAHVERQIDSLISSDPVDAQQWSKGLRYLERVPGWARRTLGYHFDPTVERWSAITPLASRYLPDRLRDSPLLPFTRILDRLREDTEAQLGTRHQLFGIETSSGLRSLNPGLRRGILLEPPDALADFREDGIYLMPSTAPDLPPVAGILTLGEGSSLSHVQLLARNLGIPNVVVSDDRLADIRPHLGEHVVLAATPGGRVVLATDGPEWDTVFGEPESPGAVSIRPDLDKLDLAATDLLDLHALRTADSGRSVGPKAANLGELAHHFPDAVSPGLVVPFGAFRAFLERSIEPGGPSAFDWMRAEYRRIEQIDEVSRQERETRAMLARLREWITTTDPGTDFRARLRAALIETFGSAATPGVFVRSDTNVEDLAGFTGAGLNRTVANVVGFEAIVDAIRAVWASPFSERSHGWRQRHMADPEHVYPAVLLQQTVAAEKSGVMVTVDVETGDRDWLTIAASEGVGGVVEGQAAEELRVHRGTGRVRLLAQASAPTRVEPDPGGGMRRMPADAPDELLRPDEIDQLRQLAADVEARFPLPPREDGTPAVADIEFGFRDGRLALFQIRPLVENRRARRDLFLMGLDRTGAGAKEIVIDLDRPPRMPD
ncbi:MAG: PEP/pyruvate-binding domain-containing protein [Pseudomonadota bacterium]